MLRDPKYTTYTINLQTNHKLFIIYFSFILFWDFSIYFLFSKPDHHYRTWSVVWRTSLSPVEARPTPFGSPSPSPSCYDTMFQDPPTTAVATTTTALFNVFVSDIGTRPKWQEGLPDDRFKKRMNLCDMFNRLSCKGLLPLHGQSVKIWRAAFTAGALVIC